MRVLFVAKPLELASEFVVLGPDLAASTVSVTEALWAEIDERFGDFAGSCLVSTFAFDAPWPTWEMHPAGDEFIYLLEGDTELLLASPDGQQDCRLAEPGQYLLVPRGTWHTARPRVATRLLFVTPGQGTENRQRLPWDEGVT
jgi:mannose-6-phosphate isomerase-like protein (cupin superfamily)